MSHMNRVIQEFELQVKSTPEEKAYQKGFHAGQNRARTETLLIAAMVALIGVLLAGLQ